MKPIQRRMSIYLTGGGVVNLKYPPQTDATNVVAVIEQAMSKNMLIVEVDDHVVYIPFASIQRIEVAPKPARLPTYAIKKATVVG